MIRRIHSAIIWTDNLRRLLAFYRDQAGLEVEQEFGEFVVFKAGGGPQLALGKHSEVSGVSKDPNRIMLNFEVADCDAAYRELSGRGVQFIREPSVDPNDGIKIATFKDPDGNTLQLFQAP
jgi:predicted enzyme related to lactoylglutathione lyase